MTQKNKDVALARILHEYREADPDRAAATQAAIKRIQLQILRRRLERAVAQAEAARRCH